MQIQLSLAERLKALFLGKVKTKEPTAETQKPKSHTKSNLSSSKQDNQAAIQLISLLQKHGRLVDFIFENIDSYSDEEVGAGVRIVHEGCKKNI